MSALLDKNQIELRAEWDKALLEKRNRDLSKRTAWEMFDDEGYTTLDDLLDREYVRDQLLPATKRNFEEAFRVMKEVSEEGGDS